MNQFDEAAPWRIASGEVQMHSADVAALVPQRSLQGLPADVSAGALQEVDQKVRIQVPLMRVVV